MVRRLLSFVILVSCFYLGGIGLSVRAADAEIGKLFLTPLQRERINHQRERYLSQHFRNEKSVKDMQVLSDKDEHGRIVDKKRVSAVITGPNGSLARINGHYIKQSEAQVCLDRKIMASEVVKIESNKLSKKRKMLSNP